MSPKLSPRENETFNQTKKSLGRDSSTKIIGRDNSTKLLKRDESKESMIRDIYVKNKESK